MAFRGGIICISNRELHDDELLGAFKSRVHTLNYDPTDAQLGALMLDLADRGWPAARPAGDPPAECPGPSPTSSSARCCGWAAAFDLRLFVNKALPDYQQWKDDETESDWRDLVTASIEEHLVAVRHADERPIAGRSARRTSTPSCGRSCGTPGRGGAGPGLGQNGRASRSGRSTGGWRRCSDSSGKCQTVKVSAGLKSVTRGGVAGAAFRLRSHEDQRQASGGTGGSFRQPRL